MRSSSKLEKHGSSSRFTNVPQAQAQALSRRHLKNEADVRSYFVPEFLSMLGYRYPRDIQNAPALDSPEYHIGTRKRTAIYPDHLVSAKNRIAFALDAKSPKIELQKCHVEQVLSYALHPDVQAEISVLTNGRQTLIIHTRRREGIISISQRDIPSMLPDLQLLLGRQSLAGRIGDLAIERRLGRGSFGTVYLAWNFSLNRHEAIKIFHPAIITPETTRRRLVRGLQAQAKLRHESIAQIYHYYGRGTEIIASMQYSPGAPLDQWIRGNPSIEQRIRLLAQVARAVHFAHTQGVVHRDLKPSNILVEHSDSLCRPLIVDFDTAVTENSANLTKTAESVGTPGYMAPEMLDERTARLGKRRPTTDIYSLGAIAYFSLFGSPPGKYAAPRRLDHLLKSTLRGLDKGQARKLMATINKAIDREPGVRHVTAELLANDLEEALSETSKMTIATEQGLVDYIFSEIDRLNSHHDTRHPRLKNYEEGEQTGRFSPIQGVGEVIIMYDFDHRELMAGLSFPTFRLFNRFLEAPELNNLREALGRRLIIDEPTTNEHGGVYVFWRLSEISRDRPEIVAERALEIVRKIWNLLT